MIHPDVRPEEQHRLIPRDGGTRFIHCPCDYGAEARCLKHGGADTEQAEPPTPLDRAREIIRERADQSVLDDAKAVIRERGETYDHPLPNHPRIAAMWSVILGAEVTPLQVVQCMIAVKLARLIVTPEHRDSWVDVVGYVACAEQIIDGS